MITYDKKNVVVLYNNCRLISIQIHSENKIRNLLFFLKESHSLQKLHIDGADFYANYKG